MVSMDWSPMANEAEVEIEQPTEDGHGDECSCGYDELPEDAQNILQMREIFDAEPERFSHEQAPFLGFEVDDGLRTIIEDLWVMGLPTDFSCEGYAELCHPLLPNGGFYAQIVFLRVSDATRFYVLLTELFGSGTMFASEGFQLTAMEGYLEDLPEPVLEEAGQELFKASLQRTRGEVLFHPEYLPHIQEVLEHITAAGELDAKRALLDVAEDLDEAYETLGLTEFRELAELDCSCGEEH